ncbi:MAG: acetyl-CoA carboxylase biotin carboxyl carrier protein [Cyclobacteriaceae bacterium]|jgi:acetyl-CoA carboxylase biotin carboxyl carrier protein
MKIKEIKDLIDFLSASGLEEVNIETEELKIKIKRSSDAQLIERTVSASPVVQAVSATETLAPAVVPSSNNYVEIKSPMIGTFYTSSSPDTNEFVSIGDIVGVGETVCVIEAMKLFNEIESEISGTIVKVLVENAQPVEFDQPLFLVDPS